MLRPLVRRLVPVPVRVALLQWPQMLSLLRLERLPRERVASGQVVCAHQSPLRRESTRYDEAWQRAKEVNVRRAVRAFDGLRLEPGALFSWHRHLGPPLRVRGFAAGPELHDERLASGGGGGLCQVANLLFFLGVQAGLELVERHRHGLDLFPDDSRTVPFGCGATVFFPRKDLKLRNTTGVPLTLSLRVDETTLFGELRAPAPLGFRCEVIEVGHRFETDADGTRWRCNTLYRRWHHGDGSARDEWLADNRARVAW